MSEDLDRVARNDNAGNTDDAASEVTPSQQATGAASPPPATGLGEGRNELVDRARASQRALVGDGRLLHRHLAHAEIVARLESTLKREGRQIKESFLELGIDYMLARHAIAMRKTVDKHRREHPEIMNLGPSLVLLIHEADKRFNREKRTPELKELIRDAVGGTPRGVLRVRYLPSKKDPVARVVHLVRVGNVDEAGRVFAECAEDEQARLRVLHAGLRLICGESREPGAYTRS